jgi:hypothetical protein
MPVEWNESSADAETVERPPLLTYSPDKAQRPASRASARRRTWSFLFITSWKKQTMMTIVLIYMCGFLAVVATVLAAVIRTLARPNH